VSEFVETIIKGLTFAVDNPWVIVVAALAMLVLTLAYNRVMK
jgi:hypothetical protein